jgi:hypothetical protein
MTEWSDRTVFSSRLEHDADIAAEGLLTNEQVIDWLMSSKTLRRAALHCVLPGVLIGREWYFRRRDLEAWIARQDTSHPE